MSVEYASPPSSTPLSHMKHKPIAIFIVLILSFPFIYNTALINGLCGLLQDKNIANQCYIWELDQVTAISTILIGFLGAYTAYNQWQEEKKRAALEIASSLSAWWVTEWETKNSTLFNSKVTLPYTIEKWGICINNSSNTQFSDISIAFSFPKKHIIEKSHWYGEDLLYENRFNNIRHSCPTNEDMSPNYGDGIIDDVLHLDFIPKGLFFVELKYNICDKEEKCKANLIEWDSAIPLSAQYSPLTRAIDFTINHIIYRDYNNRRWHANYTNKEGGVILKELCDSEINEKRIIVSRFNNNTHKRDDDRNNRSFSMNKDFFSESGPYIST